MADRKPPEGKGYDLQKVYAENAEPFWFRWDDQWWSLPHPKMLDFEVQVRVESFNTADLFPDGDDTPDDKIGEIAKAKMDEFFALLMDDEQAAEWAEVPVRPLPMMLDMLSQWKDHIKAAEGESPASTSSSKSTGRPSKRTSAGTTKSGSPRRSRALKAAAGPPGNS